MPVTAAEGSMSLDTEARTEAVSTVIIDNISNNEGPNTTPSDSAREGFKAQDSNTAASLAAADAQTVAAPKTTIVCGSKINIINPNNNNNNGPPGATTSMETVETAAISSANININNITNNDVREVSNAAEKGGCRNQRS